MPIEIAGLEDAGIILELQKSAYLREARLYDDFNLPPLTQTLEEIEDDFKTQLVLKYLVDGDIVGSVRAYRREETCYIGRLIVSPDYQNQGIGTSLLSEVESRFREAKRFELFTGHKSEKQIYMYEKCGYRIFKQEHIHDNLTLVYLEKITAIGA